MNPAKASERLEGGMSSATCSYQMDAKKDGVLKRFFCMLEPGHSDDHMLTEGLTLPAAPATRLTEEERTELANLFHRSFFPGGPSGYEQTVLQERFVQSLLGETIPVVERILTARNSEVLAAVAAAYELASKHNLRFIDGAVAGCAECDWWIGSGISWAAHIRALSAKAVPDGAA